MQLAHQHIEKVKGVITYKLMGSGAGNGFSIWPDWQVYSLFVQWESEEASAIFFDNNTFWEEYTNKATSNFTIYALPTKTVGTWDGKNPFKDYLVNQTGGRIVVLTRATIKKRFIPYF
jgi:hypothetical protein